MSALELARVGAYTLINFMKQPKRSRKRSVICLSETQSAKFDMSDISLNFIGKQNPEPRLIFFGRSL